MATLTGFRTGKNVGRTGASIPLSTRSVLCCVDGSAGVCSSRPRGEVRGTGPRKAPSLLALRVYQTESLNTETAALCRVRNQYVDVALCFGSNRKDGRPHSSGARVRRPRGSRRAFATFAAPRASPLGRRKIPYSALHTRNFIPLCERAS